MLAPKAPAGHYPESMYYEAETYPSPGYPVDNPCLSFWLQGARSSPLLGHRTTEVLPTSAEVVIIGSGITGAATAYYLFTDGPEEKRPKTVVMLEAREVCEGATGRNGGHCRPDCFQGYSRYKKLFGKEQALKIIQQEMVNLNLITELVEKENIDCDFWRGKTFDVPLDEESAKLKTKAFDEFKNDGGSVDGVVEFITDSVEAKRVTRMPDAVVAASFPAASLWPYKLVTHLIQLCLDKHTLNLQTSTPVLSVNEGANGGWMVETSRGSISASKVVYATNAFTATLLPEFTGGIVPGQGQCSAIVPTTSFSGSHALSHTYAYSWGPRAYDYMIQRPQDGIIILGGGKQEVSYERLAVTDDSVKQPEITEYFKTVMKERFEDWGTEVLGEGLLYDWTGIMGYTPENVPFVGELHGKPGAYICAGHCGHGMARIVSCARGLAAITRGELWKTTDLPECFQPTPERLAKFSH